MEVLQAGSDRQPRVGPRRRGVGLLAGAAVLLAAAMAVLLGRATVGGAEPPGLTLTLETGRGPVVWDAGAGELSRAAPLDTSADPAAAFVGLPDLLPRGSVPVGRTDDGVLLAEPGGSLALWDPASLLVVRRWPVTGRVTDAGGRHAVVLPSCGGTCAVVVVDTRSGARAESVAPPGLAPAGPVRLHVPAGPAPGIADVGLAYVAAGPDGGTALVLGPVAAPAVVADVAPLAGAAVWVSPDGAWAVQTGLDRVAVGDWPTADGRFDRVVEVSVPAGRLVDVRRTPGRPDEAGTAG